jgi:hypothetical protein
VVPLDRFDLGAKELERLILVQEPGESGYKKVVP